MRLLCVSFLSTKSSSCIAYLEVVACSGIDILRFAIEMNAGDVMRFKSDGTKSDFWSMDLAVNGGLVLES